MNQEEIFLRKPRAKDGAEVHDLISRCPPLNTNSIYCNLLQCSHFADTSIAAELEGKVVGFASGYLIPNREQTTLFIWQIAVDYKARRKGLAKRMLMSILERPEMASVEYLETTVTSENQASVDLYKSLASDLGVNPEMSVIFDQQRHLNSDQGTEYLVRIGPIRK